MAGMRRLKKPFHLPALRGVLAQPWRAKQMKGSHCRDQAEAVRRPHLCGSEMTEDKGAQKWPALQPEWWGEVGLNPEASRRVRRGTGFSERSS